MLLLAGCPGTGKSYFDNWIRKEIPNFFNETSIDVFKEKLYDEKGFDTLEERTALDNQAYSMFYSEVEHLMKQGKSIISDYPFSYRQHDTLDKLAQENNFQIITITLIADPNILYERQKERDLDPSRHLGHLMTHYHKGDMVKDRRRIEIRPSKAEYEAFNEKRDYASFKLGKTIFLDVTNFKTAKYKETIQKIKELIK